VVDIRRALIQQADCIMDEQRRDSLTAEEMLAGLSELSEECGLRAEFLKDLLGEGSDWSFVVKAHALLESIVCQLLANHMGQSPLQEVFAERVHMEDRIEMLKVLGIAGIDDRRKMRELGKLRNRLVHNTQQTDFTFTEYLRNGDNRRKFAETYGRKLPDPAGGPGAVSLHLAARWAILVSVVDVMAILLQAKKRDRIPN
jgi:hypothetical protein